MPTKSTASTARGAKKAGGRTASSAPKRLQPKTLPVSQNTFQNLVILTDFGDDVANAQIEMRFRNVAQWVHEERTKRTLMPADITLPKAAAAAVNPAVMHVTDIPFGNIDYAGYALYCCYRALGRSRPNVFIHVCDPGVGAADDRCILQTDYGNTFIGPDNGTLGLLKTYFADRGIKSTLWQLDRDRLEELEQHRMEEPSYHIPRTFHGRDIFAVAAGLVAGGVPIASFAEQKDVARLIGTNFAEKLTSLPLKLNADILCFAFRDNTYGNLKTNLMLDGLTFDQLIEEDAVFQAVPANASFWQGGFSRRITFSVRRVFSDVSRGAGVLYLGSTFAPEWDSRLVELALNLGNVAQKLGLEANQNVEYSGAVALRLRRLK